MATLRNLAVFREGVIGDQRYDRAALDTIVRNYNALRSYPGLQPVLVLGHDRKLVGGDSEPCLGVVETMWRDGDAIKVNCKNVAPPLADLIRAGAYRAVSSEIVLAHEQSFAAKQGIRPDLRGGRIQSIAVLGSSIPAVASLGELRDALVEEADPAVEPDEVICCTLERQGPPLRAGEWKPEHREEIAMLSQDAQSRLARLTQKVAEAEREQRATRLLLTELGPEIADTDDIGKAAHAFEASLRAAVQLQGGFIESVTDRRRALALIRRERPEALHDLTDADIERIVTHPADNRSGRPPTVTDAGAGVHPAPVTGSLTARGRNRPPTVTNRAGHDDGDHGDRFVRAVERTAAEQRINLSEATDDQKARIARLTVEQYPAAAPVYGSARIEANRLGSVERYYRLREIAAQHKLDLDRRGDREAAEKILFREENPTGSVQRALCFDEAEDCVVRRERLNFSEPKSRADAARIIARERPDLVNDFGWAERRRAKEASAPVAMTEEE